MACQSRHGRSPQIAEDRLCQCAKCSAQQRLVRPTEWARFAGGPAWQRPLNPALVGSAERGASQRKLSKHFLGQGSGVLLPTDDERGGAVDLQFQAGVHVEL